MTPLEKIIRCMDPRYDLVVRRAMARGILKQYNEEIAGDIRTSGFLRDHTDDHMADCNAAADVAEAHTPKEG